MEITKGKWIVDNDYDYGLVDRVEDDEEVEGFDSIYAFWTTRYRKPCYDKEPLRVFRSDILGVYDLEEEAKAMADLHYAVYNNGEGEVNEEVE